jgi:hypothetical protein
MIQFLPIALGIAKTIPSIAKWLGGDKAEEAAQQIVDIAEKVTGKKGDEIEEAIRTNPELAFKLKQEIMANEYSLDKMFLKDRSNARKRDIELHKMGYRNIRADIMVLVAGLVLALDITLLWLNPDMPAGIVAIFNMMVGALLAMLKDAFHFEFGSSRGSKEKDLLKNI